MTTVRSTDQAFTQRSAHASSWRAIALLLALVAVAVVSLSAAGAATAAKPAQRERHGRQQPRTHASRIVCSFSARKASVRRRRRAHAAALRCRRPAPQPVPTPPASGPEATESGTGATGQTPQPAPTPVTKPEEAASTGTPPGTGLVPVPSSGGLGWEGFGGGALPGAGWRPYASSSPFNEPVAGAAVVPNSAALVSAALANGAPGNLVAGTAETSSDWGHPVFFAQPSDPLYTLHATEGRNQLEGLRIPVPEYARPAGGADGHMTIVTPDGWEYDLWQAQPLPSGGGTLTFSNGGRTRIDGSGTGSAGTAAGFGNIAGMIRAPELAAGHINHALFIVLKCAAQGTSFGYGATTTSYGSSFVYPADHGGASCGSSNSNVPPLGARFSLAMSPAQIAALPVPSWKKTILTALAEYGGYVGDTGGSGFGLMFESSTSYTALGLPDPLVSFAKANGLPTWEGKYVFNLASGVEWSKYLRVLAPPSAP